MSESFPDYAEDELSEPDTSAVPLPVFPRERYDLRILSSLRRIIRAVDIYSHKLAQEYGVTVPQLLCMLKIDELGPLTQRQLAEEVFLNPSTLVGIVDRLEKSSIFMRERSVKDRRRIRISLTETGKQVVAQTPSPLQDTLAGKIESLAELERATIALSLEKVLELMQPTGACDPEIPDRNTAPILESSSDLKATKGITPKLKG